jgi:FK506-binding protein 1
MAGEKATLHIAPFFGYGPRGDPPTIPPMSPLIFEIELLAINGQKA